MVGANGAPAGCVGIENIPAPRRKSADVAEVDQVVLVCDVRREAPPRMNWERFGFMDYTSIGLYHDAKRFATLSIHSRAMNLICRCQARATVFGV